MRAALYAAPNAPVRVETVPDPEPPPHGAVVEVRATGVCRSDWHAWVGHDPTVAFPHVGGHEFAGVVRAVGSEVGRFSGGERVTAPFCCGCGRCDECRAGHQNICEVEYQPGFDGWGSFAEYVVVPWADVNLIALPDAFGFDTAASLGCRVMTSFRALVDRARLGPGETVAIYGCGGVGLSCTMIAAALGARVIAVDLKPEALELARAFGAAETVDAGAGNPVRAIRELTGGGAHVSVDALGSAKTCQQAIRSLRRRGRHVQIGLLLAGEAVPKIPMYEVIARELELYGTHGMQGWRYDALLRFVQTHALPVERLIGARRPLTEAGDALAAMGEFRPSGVTLLEP